jgi:peptide/nickel transport system permease protein
MRRVLEILVSSAVAIWLSTTLAFFALRLLPGDAITTRLVQSGASGQVIEERRNALGLNAAPFVQYGRFLGNALRGDLGYSLLDNRPVLDVIMQRFVPTATLAAAAFIVSGVTGILSGLALALHRNRVLQSVLRLVGHLAISTPVYWSGTLVIFVFSTQLRLLPATGAERFDQLILPTLVLSFHSMGAIARVVEVSIKETARMEFVRVARAKGLPEGMVICRHIWRASLPAIASVILLQAGFLLSGTVITETLFVRPGIGRLLLDSTLQQDYPVVQGIVMLSAGIFCILNGLLELLLPVFDPRISA